MTDTLDKVLRNNLMGLNLFGGGDKDYFNVLCIY